MLQGASNVRPGQFALAREAPDTQFLWSALLNDARNIGASPTCSHCGFLLKTPSRPRPSLSIGSGFPLKEEADKDLALAKRIGNTDWVRVCLDSASARRLGGGLLSDLWRLASTCRGPGTRRPATTSLWRLR
jgi:hypothetical protein